MDRREVLAGGVALAAGAVAAGPALAQDAPFFPGFKPFRVKTTGAEINGVIGGSGPPILLLHGAPQTHIAWRLLAPKLAQTFTVIATDLRGYGDSSKPADGDNHAAYSKRPMADDQVEVMKSFGFNRFAVVGHDRGGRVAHRMMVDHPALITWGMVLDIAPAHYFYNHFSIGFVQGYPHWYSYLRKAPIPENELLAAAAAGAARATTDVQKEYLRHTSDPAAIHAMCEDYRASATVDLDLDDADLKAGRRCTVPLRALWGDKGAMGPLFDVLGIWKIYATKVTGRGLPGGHGLPEELPDMLFDEIQAMQKA